MQGKVGLSCTINNMIRKNNNGDGAEVVAVVVRNLSVIWILQPKFLICVMRGPVEFEELSREH